MARRRPQPNAEQLAACQQAATTSIVAAATALELVVRSMNCAKCNETEVLRSASLAVMNAATAVRDVKQGADSQSVGGFGGRK